MFSSLFHDYYISKHGCNIPFFGGLKISNDNNDPLCTNTSLYNFETVYNEAKLLLDKKKSPCKASETYYGIPFIERAENATM